MDTKVLIRKLNSFFCEANRVEKRYSAAWLSDVDFGGLYYNGMYVLHVKIDHIDSRYDEIKNIIWSLSEKVPDVNKLIWRVAIYNSSEYAHCLNDELPVFNEENSIA